MTRRELPKRRRRREREKIIFHDKLGRKAGVIYVTRELEEAWKELDNQPGFKEWAKK